jgi:hypothetical protein
MSLEPAGGYGTMILTGPAGQSAERATRIGPAEAIAAAPANSSRRDSMGTSRAARLVLAGRRSGSLPNEPYGVNHNHSAGAVD